MPQAAVQNFGGLTALRILSGAFEAIADPALMLFTSMFYTRAEQPSRISCWYAFNGLGVAGGGLIGTFFFRSFVGNAYRRLWNRKYQRVPSFMAIRVPNRRSILRCFRNRLILLLAKLASHIQRIQP